MHVVVDLVADSGNHIIQVATGNIETLCDVGVMGWNENGKIGSPDWVQAPTLSTAAGAFEIYLADRDKWIQRSNAGELNT